MAYLGHTGHHQHRHNGTVRAIRMGSRYMPTPSFNVHLPTQHAVQCSVDPTACWEDARLGRMPHAGMLIMSCCYTYGLLIVSCGSHQFAGRLVVLIERAELSERQEAKGSRFGAFVVAKWPEPSSTSKARATRLLVTTGWHGLRTRVQPPEECTALSTSRKRTQVRVWVSIGASHD